MPEIFPSTPADPTMQGVPPNIDRCWTCRSMFMQAWGNYGTAWSVVHQQLGVRPFLGDGALQVVPQGPDSQPSVAGQNIRLGEGSLCVFAAHSRNEYKTTLEVHGLHLRSLQIGHTLPAGATPTSVLVDGQPAQNANVQ